MKIMTPSPTPSGKGNLEQWLVVNVKRANYFYAAT